MIKTDGPQTKTEATESKDKITPDLIEKLKGDHPGIELHSLEHEIDDELFQIVVRSPQGEYERWRIQRESDDPQSKIVANKLFIQSIAVWPEKSEVTAMFNRKRGLASTFAGEVAVLMGVSQTARRKKL